MNHGSSETISELLTALYNPSVRRLNGNVWRKTLKWRSMEIDGDPQVFSWLLFVPFYGFFVSKYLCMVLYCLVLSGMVGRAIC